MQKRAYKTSVQTKVCVRLKQQLLIGNKKQQLLFAFYYLNRAGGFHFQSISFEIFLSEKFVVSGSC